MCVLSVCVNLRLPRKAARSTTLAHVIHSQALGWLAQRTDTTDLMDRPGMSSNRCVLLCVFICDCVCVFVRWQLCNIVNVHLSSEFIKVLIKKKDSDELRKEL